MGNHQHKQDHDKKRTEVGKRVRKDSTNVTAKPTVLGEDVRLRRKLEDLYSLGRKLGEGSYGKVRLGTNKKTKESVAVKSVLKKNMRRLTTLKREIEIMQSISHPHIIKMLDVFEDDMFLYIVMEVCSGGELFDRIIKTGKYTEDDAKELVLQILEAVAYLHSHKIAHRDLKPENFLFKNDSPHAPLKLIDFGLSRFYTENVSMKTRVGTPYYISPETLKKEYDQACDLWSIGVITYILLCGYPPFYGDTEKQIFNMIRVGAFDFPAEDWDGVSLEAKEIIARLLDKNPKTRITAEQALKHPWIINAKRYDESPQEENNLKQENIKVPGPAPTVSPPQPPPTAAPDTISPNLLQEQQQTENTETNISEEELKLNEHVVCRLKNFAKANKLKRAAIGVMVRYLNRSDMNSLRDQFASLDKDGNGVITINEVAQALRNAGLKPSASEVDKLVAVLDVDGNGKIDYEEFLAATLDHHIYLRDELLTSAFNYFDLEGTGSITKEDLEARLGVEDPQLVANVLQSADIDADGAISFEEFKILMNKQ